METVLELERVGRGAVTGGDGTARVRVALTRPEVVQLHSEAEVVVFDFGRKERRRYDLGARTWVRRPLHAEVNFAAAEAVNRQHILQVLEAGGAATADRAEFEQVLVEHQLGVHAPGRKRTTLGGARAGLGALLGGGPDVLTRRDGAGTRFEALGRTLAWCSDEGQASSHLGAYLHALRHQQRCHPLLLEWLRARGTVPRELRLESASVMQPGQLTFRLLEAAPGPALAEPPDWQEVSGLDGSQPVDALLDRPAEREPPLPDWARLAESRALMRGPDPVGGLLTFFELSLEQGTPMPAELAVAARQSAHPGVRKLMALLSGPRETPAACEAALADFAELRAGAPACVHLLAAFEATCQLGLGHREQGMALYAGLLAVNPRLTRAWADLGGLYLSDWSQHDRGWACWMRALRLAPGTLVVKDIEQLQRRVEEAHGECFRPG